MRSLEQESHYDMPTVDRVGLQDYDELLELAYQTAEKNGLSPGLFDVTFGLLEELRAHDEDAALGGLRAAPIALEIADETAHFYNIEIDNKWVQVTALLHDVGKTAISKDLLEKSSVGKEWTVDDGIAMRQHVVAGGAIIRKYGLPFSVSRAVEEHHSKQVGSEPYGVDSNLDYQARLYRDVTALADYEEADLNRTNSRNAHLSRAEREEEIARDVDFVLSDYTGSSELSARIVARTLGAPAVTRHFQFAA